MYYLFLIKIATAVTKYVLFYQKKFFFFVQNSSQIFNLDLTLLSNAGCAIYMLIRRVIRQIPTWIEAFITFDRYIAISHYSHRFIIMKYEYLKLFYSKQVRQYAGDYYQKSVKIPIHLCEKQIFVIASISEQLDFDE